LESEQDIILNSQKRFVVYVLAITFGILICYSFFGGMIFILSGSVEDINPWLIAVSQILFLLIPSVFAVKLIHTDYSSVFRFKLPNAKLFLVAISGVLFVQLFTEGYLSVQSYLIPQEWTEQYNKLLNEYSKGILKIIGEGDVSVLLRAIIVVAIVPSISEEFLFRGFLQTNLEKKMKPFLAITISSVLFGVIHFEPVVLIPLILIGIYLGTVSYLTGSILMPIFIHFLVNLFSVIGVIFFRSDNIEDMNKAQPIEIGIVLLLLGLAGILAVIYFIMKEYQITRKNLRAEDSNAL